MSKIFNAWEFNGNPDFLVLYGSDLALSLSLSRMEKSNFYEEEELTRELLYSINFFENIRIRSIVTTKTANNLINMYINQPFLNRCTIIVDGSVTAKGDDITFVKCEHMNSAQSKLFVNFYTQKLSIEKPKDASKIKNLDELMNYNRSLQDSFVSNIWGSIRLEQFRSRFPEKYIYQHLELWARDNAPSTECLEMIYNKVKFEMGQFKNNETK